MKKLFIYLLLILSINLVFAENTKIDFSKMSEKELMAYFMESHKRKKEALKKLEISKQKLKQSEEELSRTKKLGKTLDELNNMLGIKK